jgi:NADPH-dependent stearoyl-CoA 9-desaturase
VRALFVTYDLPYTTGPFHRQYFLTVRTICKLALPNRWLSATSDNAPETASEHKFRNVAKRLASPAVGGGVRRRGLATAILARGDRRWPAEHPTSPISGHRAGQGPAGSHHMSRARDADELNASA